MSIVGGLVGDHSAKLAGDVRSAAGEWAMRNAWSVILLTSVMFWLALGTVLILG